MDSDEAKEEEDEEDFLQLFEESASLPQPESEIAAYALHQASTPGISSSFAGFMF